MRKNFKRKNYVLFGAIGIAAVALSSVGFATWITGMQKDNATSDIQISVDTATNDTMYLDVALSEADNTINVTEKVAKSDDGKLYNNSGTPADLTFTFSKFRLIYSSIYDSKNPVVIMNVSFTKDESPASTVSYANGKISADSKASYLNFPTTFFASGTNNIALRDANESEKIAGYTVKVMDKLEIKLGWGDLFGNEAPTTHYNSQLTSEKTLEQKLAIMSEATSTLNTMSANLNGLKMNLSFTASWTGKPAN